LSFRRHDQKSWLQNRAEFGSLRSIHAKHNSMGAHIQSPVWKQTESAALSSPAKLAGGAFDFGSRRRHAASAKQKRCIIYRSQTAPALIGFTAQHLAKPIHPSTP